MVSRGSASGGGGGGGSASSAASGAGADHRPGIGPSIGRASFAITKMTIGKRTITVLAALTIVAVVLPCFTAQPPTAEESIEKDRNVRQIVAQKGKRVARTPKWGFFGTIFHLILEQVNDTKSAYNQISDLVNGQFTDDEAVTPAPSDPADNGTTPTPKISRAEFLRILDRNLKGLARLRNLEWREANKDTKANLQRYKEEIFGGKKPRKRR